MYLKTYTKLDSLQFGAFYEGFEDVVTRQILSSLTPALAKRRIVSSPTIDVKAFMASTVFKFHEVDEQEGKERFEWVLNNISNAERQEVLRFITGRKRLQPGVQ